VTRARKKELRTARAAEARFRALVEAAPDALVIVDPKGAILLVNAQLEKLFGYTRDELLGRPIEILIPESDRPRHPALRDRYVGLPRARPMGAGLDLRARRKDGSEFPAEISLSPTESPDEGRLVTAAIRDVTERKRAERKFRDLLEAAPDAMVIVDQSGRIVLVNAQTEKLFGYTRAELLGQAVELLVPNRYRAAHSGHRAGYSVSPRARSMGSGLELFGVKKNGDEFPIEISLSPLETEEGMLVSSAIRDITERRQLEIKTLEASRLKSQFLANMSHELRTPLNAIIGFSDLMHRGKVGPLSAEHHEYVGDILASAKHLLQLINDILDLAKIEAGKMEVLPEVVFLPSLVKELKDTLRGLASSKRLELRKEIDPEVATVTTDPARVKQILYNFISNAIKFTPPGGSIVVRARPEGPKHFRLEVEDTGIGIAPESISNLFVEFHQLDVGSAKRYEGTGLGLALTKRIAEALGGAVGVRSTPSKGSSFHVVLPRAVE
jgi:protein-histidine pros-kinase